MSVFDIMDKFITAREKPVEKKLRHFETQRSYTRGVTLYSYSPKLESPGKNPAKSLRRISKNNINNTNHTQMITIYSVPPPNALYKTTVHCNCSSLSLT